VPLPQVFARLDQLFLPLRGLAALPPLLVECNAVLRVSIAGDQRRFHVGETTPIQLSFSTAVRDRYQVDMATYGGSGRTEHEHFSVSPSDGAVDPLANRGGSISMTTDGSKLQKLVITTIR
jgi:hypothetical protein